MDDWAFWGMQCDMLQDKGSGEATTSGPMNCSTKQSLREG